MAVPRKKRKKVDVIAVKLGRARNKSYAQIARDLGVSPSATWYALNREQHLQRRHVPAGHKRTVYLDDESWQLLAEWGAAEGLNYSRMVLALIERERDFRAGHDPLPFEPAIEGAQ